MTRNIIFIMLMLCMGSCFNDPIDLDLNEGSEKLVIVAWINDLDEPQSVSLSKTVNFLGDNNPELVSDATVLLQDAVQTYTLNHSTKGEYYLPDDFQARVGDLYKLQVDYEGVSYTAEHVMRPCPVIENFRFTELTEEVEGSEDKDLFVASFSFQESPGEGDAYFAIDYPKGSAFGKYFTEGGFTDDEFVDGEYFEDVEVGNWFHEKGDTVVLDLFSIGKETSDFLSDIETEIFRDGPFDPPPANIRTNITGGAVGYFIASGGKREIKVVE